MSFEAFWQLAFDKLQAIRLDVDDVLSRNMPGTTWATCDSQDMIRIDTNLSALIREMRARHRQESAEMELTFTVNPDRRKAVCR